MTSRLAKARRVVVKIGSALLVDGKTGAIKASWLTSLIDDLADQRVRGAEIIIVSSGAIALGRRTLGLAKGKLKLEQSQAAAAVGQIALAQAWAEALRTRNIVAAQVLVTLGDTEERRRYLNARATLSTLLAQGAIPVINENDTVATDEIRVGDNDTLGSLVTNLVEADVMIILTDQAGLFSADPRKNPAATLIETADASDPALERMAGGAGSEMGRGGMLTKITAAQRAARGGAHTLIASGHEPDVLVRLANGEKIGTLLLAKSATLAARKQWLADHLQVRGQVMLDAGAAKALKTGGKSLLPIGVYDVKGEFERGEVVSCHDESNREIARGLINYSAAETRRILRTPSGEIESKLGYMGESELIHRDDMVLL